VDARRNIKRINTDFLKLINGKLEELEEKHSTGHFKENKKLFDELNLRWGKKKEVKREDVIEYLKEIANESKPKSNKHLRRIRALYNYGIKQEWFTYNPATNISPYAVKKFKKYIPSKVDVIKVLSLANNIDRCYLLMLIHTLCRVRELNFLKWVDVHEEYLTLWTKKSKDSNEEYRDIPLNSVLKEVIKEIPKKGEYLFINPRTNTCYDYRDKFLKTLCKKAEIKDFTFHCLRHFGASVLSSGGAGLGDIQGILGHSNISTTSIYIQSLQSGLENAMTMMEDVK
jgi:integrase